MSFLKIKFFQACFLGLTVLVLFFSSSAHALESLVFHATAEDLSIASVRALSPKLWEPVTANNTVGTYPKKTVWLKVELPELLPSDPILLSYRNNLNQVCLFTAAQQTCRNFLHTNALSQPIPDPEPNFSLRDLEVGERTVYFKIRSDVLINFPLTLENRQTLLRKVILKQWLDGIAIGLFVAMLLVNVILALWFREWVYFLHSLSLSAWAVSWFGLILGYSRFGWAEIHSPLVGFQNVLRIVSLGASIGAYYTFAHHDLSVMAKRFVQGLLVLMGVFFISSLLPLAQWHMFLVDLAGVGMIVSLSVGIVLSLYYRRLVSAFYLGCWFVFYASFAQIIALRSGFLSYQLFSFTQFSWQQALGVFMSTMTLGFHFRQVYQRTHDLQSENLRLVIEHQETLEGQIKERTKKLSETISALALTNQELEKHNLIKTRLFAILAHDLRSPFASIITLMGIFQNNPKYDASDPLLGLLDRLKHSVVNLMDSLNGMLHWLKAELDGYPANPKSVEVSTLLDTVVDLYRENVEQKGITLQVMVPKDLRLFADGDQVRLILRNILNNALKFTPEAGNIQVGAFTLEDQVCIEIRDDGSGFLEEDIQKIMQRESLVSRSGTGGEKGLGLGLQAVQSYVTVNQGNLIVENSEQGAVVKLFFPREK